MAKILVVEDDEAFRETLCAWLEAKDHKVDAAADGIAGMEFLRAYTYDLLILDWNLPGMTGIDICRKYRASGGAGGVIMLTGQKELDDKETGLDTGADDYITKPCEPRELLARIRALLRRPNITPSEVLTYGPVTCDTNARTVTVGSTNIRLSPTEYSVFEFLLRRPNQVFSCEQLLKQIWTADDEVSLDSVYTTMNRLRKKIQVEEVGQLIQTVHGAGYKFVVPN